MNNKLINHGVSRRVFTSKTPKLSAGQHSSVYSVVKFLILFAAGFLFWSCDLFHYGKLGGADISDTYYPGDQIFEERMDFLCGVWYSHYAGIGRLDGYRVRRWSDLTAADRKKVMNFFRIDLDAGSPRTYATQDTPKNSDYIFLYDSTVYGKQEDEAEDIEHYGAGFMGLVRAFNIFNGDKERGAVIIEYFEGTDPRWLSDPGRYNYQGLKPGEKPSFGIYYRVLSPNIVQMANAVDLAALYAGRRYYTEKETLEEAIDANSVENEAEFISWGVVIPQDREME